MPQVLAALAGRSRAGANIKRQLDDCAKAAAERVYGRPDRSEVALGSAPSLFE
jgi:hypothetical protein